MSNLSAPHFHDEQAAHDYIEARVWANGRVCPHCGVIEKSGKLAGKSTRVGLYKCYACRKPFTVKVGTVFESSHVKLHLWLQAIYLMAASKKGISANQLHRTLGVTLKTAWFMSHRIREAMRSGDLSPMGSGGGIVEIDETFIGAKADARYIGPGYAHKNAVLTLVDRSGSSRSFHIDRADKANIWPIINANLDKEARVVTDDAGYYRTLNTQYTHAFVRHAKGEYSKGEITTNNVEGYFSIFKRGMRGIYQHCSEKHLHRYLAEFDFRYSNRKSNGYTDTERAEAAVMGIVGKRLTYRGTNSKAA